MEPQVRERSGGKPWLIGGALGCLAAVIVGAALAAGAYFWRAKQMRATPVATASAPATETIATTPPPVTTTTAVEMPAEVPTATETAVATEAIDTAASAVAPLAPVEAPAAAKPAPPPPKPLAPAPTKKKTTSTKTSVAPATDETQPAKPSKSSSKSVILSVSSTVEDSSEITTALRREIRSRLESRGIDVGDDGYKASVVISRVREVSRTKRVLMGAFAGKAGIDVDISLRDPDGSKVGSTKVEGRSSGKTIFSGTSSQAIDQAAEKIASFIAGKL